MNDALRRALRGLVQLIAGGGLTALFDTLAVEIPDPTLKVAIGIAATFLVTWAQNELEDREVIPAVLKAPASDGANPVPAPGPARDERGRFVSERAVSDIALMVVGAFVAAIVLIILTTL